MSPGYLDCEETRKVLKKEFFVSDASSFRCIFGRKVEFDIEDGCQVLWLLALLIERLIQT